MQIGTLSERTNCNIETIRYYERTGVMPEPPRTEGGHRVYSEDHLKRLVFIRKSRHLGFSLDQIRGLLELVDRHDFTCDEVRDLTLSQMADVKQKVADLRKIEKILKNMVSHCDKGAVPDCPVIDALFDAR